MSKRLLLLGGGHAHMQTLSAIPDLAGAGHEVVLVAPSPYYYYTGMGPGAFGGRYDRSELRFDLKRIVERGGGQFLADRAIRIDAAASSVTLAGGDILRYDILSCNVGSDVTSDFPVNDSGEVYPIKPIEQLLLARERIVSLLERQESVTCAVVGGGAGAVEVAGNAWRIAWERRGAGAAGQLRIRLISEGELLTGFPKRFRWRARRSLQRRGIEVHEGCRAVAASPGEIRLDDGERLSADLVLLATGIAPPSLFRDSGLSTGVDGGLLVNEYLQSVDVPEIFGGGDCIAFQPQRLDRVGVYAARENPVLADNLRAVLDDRWSQLRPFQPGGAYLLALNMGDGTALVARNGLVLGGRCGLRLKEYFDRSFVRRYQVPETSEEPVRS